MRGDEARQSFQSAISRGKIIIPFFKDFLVVQEIKLTNGERLGLNLACYEDIDNIEQEMLERFGLKVEAQKVFSEKDPLPFVVRVPMVSSIEILFWPMQIISHLPEATHITLYKDDFQSTENINAICSQAFGEGPNARTPINNYLMARKWFSGR